MTNRPWQRLSSRLRGEPVEQTLHEGVPAHLEQNLRMWIMEALSGRGAEQVAMRLGIRIDYERARGDGARFLALAPQPDELLDIIDAILSLGGPWLRLDEWETISGQPDHRRWEMARVALAEMLKLSESSYCINAAGDGLTVRVDSTVAAALASATATATAKPDAGSAAAHLAAAWEAAHRLHPDPPKAYSEAIKAVESAAHAVVQPKQPAATLGTILGELRATTHLYTLAIPGPNGAGDIAPLIGMIELLWQGQSSRHGAMTTTRLETIDEARMAVGLAVTLVDWFTTGAVRRTRPHRRRG